MKPVFSFIAIFALLATSKGQLVGQFLKTEQSVRLGESLETPEMMINGEHVKGTPFLLNTWLPGSVTLKDGRVYTDYKLKYDAYGQAVYFLNGTDSLEVSDPVKEFMLNSNGKEMHFINADEHKKSTRPLYYEVLIDDEKGQLLKTVKKVVGTDNKALVEVSSLKCFIEKNEYFYFDNKSGKLTAIKSGGSNIKAILGIPDSQPLDISTYNLANESDLVSLFLLNRK